MRVLFIGGISGNSGPANANRGFVEHWPGEDEIFLLDGKGKARKLLALIAGAFKSDVVLTTGPGKLDSAARTIAKVRGKAVIGFCHGYAPYENKVNDLGMSAAEVESFAAWLDDCDLVVTNSALQMRFLVDQQPSLKGKVAYAHLGVEPFSWKGRERTGDPRLIVAVSGGTRPIKANEVVARAIGILKDKGVDVRLDVYGRRYSPNDELDELVRDGSGTYLGQASHKEFIQGLRMSSVFVMNSRRESFWLSALDAIEAGTSVLLSRNCGVAEVLGLRPSDFIDDCEDAEEVAEKIMALRQAPNAERIYKGLNFSALSWRNSSARLRDLCAAVAGVERLR